MRTEDGSIIYECLNGKPEAFGILIDKYKAGIYAFVCAEVRNFHDAEDVTQEVFIQACRDLRSLRRWESFAGDGNHHHSSEPQPSCEHTQ